MSSGIAQRRAAKAARRKKLLAERRKLAQVEAKPSLAEQMRRLSTAPLDSCLMQQGLFERGNGIVILTRKASDGKLAFASFLVDVFCLGVKSTVFRQSDEWEINDFIEAIDETAPLAEIDPSYARKLLRDLVAWSRSLGIEPHSDYAALELLFGDSSAASCDVTFHFGQDGKPLYIPGPEDTPARIRRRVEQLRRQLGDGGFDVMLVEEHDDFEAEDMEGYDPDQAPDPAEWLALDEDKRLFRVQNYHRRAGIELPNDRVHAVLHVVVENQIALGDELPVRRTVERLMEEGLDRHEAIHAVAVALAEHIHEAAQLGKARPISQEAYNAAVERITAESWRRQWESQDEQDSP